MPAIRAAESFPMQHLTEINDSLKEVISILASQLDQKTAVLQANSDLDQIMPQIFQVSAQKRPVKMNEAITAAEDAFASFVKVIDKKQTATDKILKTNNENLETMSQKVKAMEEQFENLVSGTKSQLTDWQSDFASSQTTRESAFSSDQSARTAEFSEAQRNADKAFDSDLNNWKEELKNQTSDISKNYDQSLKVVTAVFEDYVAKTQKDIQDKHKDVLMMHELFAVDTVAGGYSKSASDEQTSANKWRWISMAAFAIAAAWLAVRYYVFMQVYSGFETLNNGLFNWSEVITTSSLTAILLGMGGYAANQSKMHRDNEKRMRSFALETKALDPFMALLSKEQQQQIKAELIRRMFGQQNNEGRGKAAKLDKTSIEMIGEKISDVLKK